MLWTSIARRSGVFSQFPAGERRKPASFIVTKRNWWLDLIGKIPHDPTAGGHHLHIEIAGVLRNFRLFNPVTNTTSSVTAHWG